MQPFHRFVEVAGDFRAHEKSLRRRIDEFLIANDVQRFAEKDAGDLVNKATAVRAFDIQNARLH